MLSLGCHIPGSPPHRVPPILTPQQTNQAWENVNQHVTCPQSLLWLHTMNLSCCCGPAWPGSPSISPALAPLFSSPAMTLSTLVSVWFQASSWSGALLYSGSCSLPLFPRDPIFQASSCLLFLTEASPDLQGK